jgi:hypothetical protein
VKMELSVRLSPKCKVCQYLFKEIGRIETP